MLRVRLNQEQERRREVRSEGLAGVPIDDSFCQIGLRDREFRTDNSVQNTRLDGHEHPGQVVCYHGVPAGEKLATSGNVMPVRPG